MKRFRNWLLLFLAILFLLWIKTSLFIIEATETGIMARFSRPLDTVYGPGLHPKFPWPVDAVYRFDQRLFVFDHNPTEFLTQDKKNILIDSFAVWRIGDEHIFLAKVRNRDNAEILLLEILTAVLGEVVGTYPLSAFINTEEGRMLLGEINQKIADACRGPAGENYGVEVVDVRINRFNFPSQNRASVIKRMRTERERIATRYRSEGEEAALRIEAATELETRTLLAEAGREAEAIRGRGEAEAIGTYGAAYAVDPEFYLFLRTLETYDAIIDQDTTLILSSDSELFRMLEEGAP